MNPKTVLRDIGFLACKMCCALLLWDGDGTDRISI
jgi:hypothetical protein